MAPKPGKACAGGATRGAVSRKAAATNATAGDAVRGADGFGCGAWASVRRGGEGGGRRQNVP